MSIHRSLVSLLAVSLLAPACEDPPKPDATAKSAAPSAAPAPAPTPTPTPAAAPEAPKAAAPKKKLEDCGKGPNFDFDNPAVEAEVRLKAQKKDGPVTFADLKKVKSLNLSNAKQPQLDVCLLAQVPNIHELFLGPGEYDDLTPIYALKELSALGIARSQVKDISGITKLKKLDRLDMAHTPIADFTPLASLTDLTELTLDDTQISDVTPLTKLTKLEKLGLKQTKVKDASPLKVLKKLKILYIGNTPADEEGVSLAGVRGNGTKVISD